MTPASVIAQHAGHCPVCDQAIVADVDEVVWSEEENAWAHEECAG